MPDTAQNKEGRRKLGPTAITGLVSTVIALMLLALLTPAINSGAHDIPLAVLPREVVNAVGW